MTVGRLLLIILLVVSGWFVYNDWKKKSVRKEWELKISSALRPDRFSKDKAPDEKLSNVWMLIAVTIGAETAHEGDVNFVMTEWVRTAAGLAGMNVNEAEAISVCVAENVAICRRCGAADKEGFNQMASGEAPVAKLGAFSGEKLVLTPIVPATLAPLAAWHPGNLQVVPESVAQFNSMAVPTDRVITAAKKLEPQKLVSTEALNTLTKMQKAIQQQ